MQIDRWVADIENVPPAKGFNEVRVPGYKSQRARQQKLESGELEVEDAVYEKFLREYDELVTPQK